MNANEIEYIEARLPAGLHAMPSPEQMERFIASVRHERNQHIAASFARLVTGTKSFAEEVRRIAAACTAARLHLPNVNV